MRFPSTNKIRKLLLIALALVWLLASIENSAPSVQAQSGDIFVFDGVIDNSIGANAVALGDLDNDGDLDAYLGLKDSTKNKTYFNQQGNFANPVDTGLAGSTKAVALGDMDNDGYLDAVVGNGSGELDVVEYNDGEGNLVFPSSLPNSQAATNAVEVSDIDQDGDLDILLATDQNSYIRVNQGGAQGGTVGIFASGQILATSSSLDLAVGDLDQDNDPDVAVIMNGGQAIQLWLNSGGVFQAGATLPFEPGTFVSDLAVGPINNDDLPDMYIVTPNGPDLVAINNGFNSFNPGQSVPAGNSQDVVLSDVDGDGDLDAVVAVWEYGASGDQVWLNDNGTFSQAQILTDSRSVALAAGDVNGDTTPDVLLARLEGPKMLWTNQLVLMGTDLSVTISGPETLFETIAAWENIITITARGQFTATNVVVTKMSAPYDSEWPIIAAPFTFCGSQPNCLLGSIPVGSAFTFPIDTYKLFTIPGFFQMQALAIQVHGDELDPNPANNMAELTTYIYNCDNTTCWLERAFCKASKPERPSLQSVSQVAQAAFNLPIYYQLRDEILSPTPAGQHYRDLYYTHDPELQTLILNDPDLFNQALSVLNLWDPNLAALVAGNGDSVTITGEQVAAISGFLFNLSQVASPELQQVIDQELTRLGPLNDYVGLTMAEAAVAVVGAAPGSSRVYLPLVLK